MNPLTITDFLNVSEQLERRQWEPFGAGVTLSRVQGDPGHAPAAALLRYEPGARVPQHHHMGWEYILVMAGAQQDEHGRYDRGTLRINPPGSRHSVESPDGCVVFVVWEKSVAFVESHEAKAAPP